MTDEARRLEQLERERTQRDAATGRRARSILRGDLGPVLKRWVSATVLPTSARVREFSERYLRGETVEAGLALRSPVFGLPEVGGGRTLEPILKWTLSGHSKGRAESGTTYAEDLVLAIMGTAMMKCSVAGEPIGMGPLLFACADAARETALGQFISTVQGAKAMQSVRRSKDYEGGLRHSWQKHKQMDAVAALLGGQARDGLAALASSGVTGEVAVGGREAVTVLNQKGDPRHLELRVPAEDDWKLLDLARRVKGEADTHKSTWASFAMIVIAAAQAEAGVFELVGMQSRTGHRAKHGITLSGEAHAAIKRDLDRWLRMGFLKEPMLTVPEDGGYLSVKTKGVAGGAGPKGVRTNAEGTTAWFNATAVMAATPWRVADETLRWTRGASSIGAEMEFRSSDSGRDVSVHAEPDPGRRELVLGSYARLAGRDFYLPIYMDFRGRVYPKPTVVTYQGSDLQKGLLCFPEEGSARELDADAWDCLILHLGNLYKHGGLDKAPLEARWDWYYGLADREVGEIAAGAKKPLQFYTALSLIRAGQPDRVPCQIDGTCNGLQHLSALFRDETAAREVNLTRSSLEGAPADIYAAVAHRVSERLSLIDDPWARRLRATLRLDRDLCKQPVMVLPYGGTRGTIEDAVLGAVLEQSPSAIVQGRHVNPWAECLRPDSAGGWTRDDDAVAADYLAFRERPLAYHPLLKLDCKRLGGLVWLAITETLPRPMAAMQAFRSIAKSVGSRSLEWSLGTGSDTGSTQGGAIPGMSPLWVVQAKAKSAKSSLSLKGLHLPDSIRGLAMRVGKDEVDPSQHAQGIVANFIHSQDADHLSRTMGKFLAAHTPPSFGAVHDNYWTRPSLMPALARVTREAFYEKYRDGCTPLDQPVRLRSLGDMSVEEFPSWHKLAEACGTKFPEVGSWDPREVLDSAWFFS